LLPHGDALLTSLVWPTRQAQPQTPAGSNGSLIALPYFRYTSKRRAGGSIAVIFTNASALAILVILSLIACISHS
jgi:hypothetical protein